MLNQRMDRYLYKVLKIILSSIFLLPFIVRSDFYFPFVTPRNFLFRIIVSLALAIYLFLYFRNKEKFAIIKNKVLVSYISLALIITIASLVNGDFLYGFWSNYERMEGLLTSYYLIALLIVILGVYKDKKAWLELLRISIWTSMLMSIMAMSQHWGINLFIESSGGERVTATLGNATYLAVYALFNFFFALYLLFKCNDKRPKLELWFFYILDTLLIVFEIFGNGKGILAGVLSDLRIFLLFIIPQVFINLQYYFYNTKRTIKYSWLAYLSLIMILNFSALFNTQTRGVLVGLFIAAFVVSIFLLFSKYVKKKLKYIILGFLVTIVFLGSGVFVFKNTNFIRSNNTLLRLASISVSDTTTETRLLTWQLSLKAWQEKPILGWGEEKFYVAFNKYFPNQIFEGPGSRVWFDRPHNVFLQQLVHGGILGLLAYLAIFTFALYNLWKHYIKTKNPITISILGGLLIAYLVQNFFVFDSLNSYIPMIIFLAITIFLAGDFKKDREVKNNNSILAVIAALAVLLIGFNLNIPQTLNNHNFIKQYNNLRNSIADGSYKRAETDKLLSIIDNNYLGKFELRQVYAEFIPNLIHAKILSPVETKYFVDTAEKEMLASIKEQPDNVRHHSFLLNLYLQASILDPGYSQKGIDLIEKEAIPLSPTRIQLYYSLGQFYMNLGQNSKALANFTKGKELAPKVFDSYYNLFIAYLTINDLDKAKLEIEEMEKNVEQLSFENYVRLGKVYEYFKFPEEVENLKNRMIESLQ